MTYLKTILMAKYNSSKHKTNPFIFLLMGFMLFLTACDYEKDYTGSYIFTDMSHKSWEMDIDNENEAYFFQVNGDMSYPAKWKKVVLQKGDKDNKEISYVVFTFLSGTPNVDFQTFVSSQSPTFYFKDNVLYESEDDMNRKKNGLPTKRYNKNQNSNVTHTDENGLQYSLDENGNPYYIDANGQYFYKDQNGQYYYLDQNGNTYYLDQNGTPYYLDQNGNAYYIDNNGNAYYP